MPRRPARVESAVISSHVYGHPARERESPGSWQREGCDEGSGSLLCDVLAFSEITTIKDVMLGSLRFYHFSSAVSLFSSEGSSSLVYLHSSGEVSDQKGKLMKHLTALMVYPSA